MKRYSTVALALAVAATAACKDNPVANPIDNPTADALGGLTHATLQLLATGVLGQDRANADAFSYLGEPGIWARNVYRIDASEPRFVQETLGGNPDPGSFSGSGAWNGYYTAIRASNTVLLALDKAPPAEFTPAEASAIRGFFRTVKALEEWRVIEMHDSVGATIQTDDQYAVNPIRCKPAILAYVAALLDSANADLTTAGGATTFPFALPSGFTSFGRNYSSVANFILFNRGLKGKVDYYRAIDRTNPTPALFATAIAELTTALGAGPGAVPPSQFSWGPYYTFVAGGSENTPNVISDSKVRLNPLVLDSIQAGDTRRSKIVTTTTLTGFGLSSSITYSGATATTANQNAPLGILRDEELVLLRAQAEIEAGQFANAILDVNDVRTNYGLPATTFATVADGRNAVLYEKRYSLLFEGPQRADDLREYGMLNATYHRPETATDPFNAALPIPRGELNARNLTVNPACTP
ncbi:MAG: RagB/SusD family nutrient uptake outer membrane protein [Gemmatimonadaceae bacterium]